MKLVLIVVDYDVIAMTLSAISGSVSLMTSIFSSKISEHGSLSYMEQYAPRNLQYMVSQ